MNIKEAIALIVLVEKAYPNRTTSQIVDTLRLYGGYDTSIWKAIDFLNSRPETQDIFESQSRRFNRVFSVTSYTKNNPYITTQGSSLPDEKQTRRAQDDFKTWLNNWIQNNNSYDFYNYPPISSYEEGSDLALEYIDGIENFAYEMTILNIDPSSDIEEVYLQYTFNSIEGNYLTNPDAETIALMDSDSNI